MSEIKLKNLTLKNFKGIKELSLAFDQKTNIYGDNGTGKTSIFDAVTWLLFDKDSQDRTTFEIKTLDESGSVIHGLEHSVVGTIEVDGREITLTKILKEKWTKKRGEATKQLTGHETLYYLDEVPVKQAEYKSKISNIIDENLFKLISNPLYFSNNLKWQDRRKVILNIIGDVSTERIISYNKSLKALENLLSDKDIETLKKSISARKKKLNDDIKSIPYRVDECNNSITDIDFNALEFRKRGIIPAIKSLENQLMDSSKVNEESLNEKENLYSMKSKLKDIVYKANMEAYKPKQELEYKSSQIHSTIFKLNSQVKELHDKKAFYENQILQFKKQADELRTTWFTVNKEMFEFDESTAICPTCKRLFEEHDIESKKQELEGNFNQHKSKRLESIRTQGVGIKSKIEKIENDINSINLEIDTLYNELNTKAIEKQDIEEKINSYTPTDTLLENQEYQVLKSKITTLEEKLNQPTEVDNQVQDIKERKLTLEKDLEQINRELGMKEQNERLKVRIKELMDEEQRLSQQIAELEGQEFLCDKYIKSKVELLESSINSKFRFVKFKLFNTLVNGAIDECCEALIDGVPFSNANTASQTNAGLDIINALSQYYNIEAPIFIDNRESVNKIIDCNSQIINLIVSEDKTLKLLKNESEVA